MVIINIYYNISPPKSKKHLYTEVFSALFRVGTLWVFRGFPRDCYFFFAGAGVSGAGGFVMPEELSDGGVAGGGDCSAGNPAFKLDKIFDMVVSSGFNC